MRREEMLETANEGQETVLILVLVEYAPRGLDKGASEKNRSRLNPCFSGICAAR